MSDKLYLVCRFPSQLANGGGDKLKFVGHLMIK